MNQYRVCSECVPEWQERKLKRAQLKDERDTAYHQEAWEGEVCHVCLGRRKKRKLIVDYDAERKVTHGLLCYKCLLGLRQFNWKPETLTYALEYAKRREAT